VGRTPVIKLAREGLQEGAEQWAFVKRTPREARRSRFGVCTPGRPPRQFTQSFRSSTAIKRTLGLFDRGEQLLIQAGTPRAAVPALTVFMNSLRDHALGFIGITSWLKPPRYYNDFCFDISKDFPFSKLLKLGGFVRPKQKESRFINNAGSMRQNGFRKAFFM